MEKRGEGVGWETLRVKGKKEGVREKERGSLTP